MSKRKKRKGRPPLPKGEKKSEIRFFAHDKHIDKCGGEESAKQIALSSIENFEQNLAANAKK